uniref:Protein arginine methyltransferase NDUFAF7 n=1 Tax=Chlamydomonas leiostraca TaxID=1034604 RepID=A0A7S0WVC3_9CHLO
MVVDYGRDGPYSDSLMAIKQHKGVQVLDEPGSADLSAWVDFGALRHASLGAAAAAAATSRNPLSDLTAPRATPAAPSAQPKTILTTLPGATAPGAAGQDAAATAEQAAAEAAAGAGAGAAAKTLAGPVAVWGPVPQGSFLLQLGMAQRLEVLAQRASPEQAAALRTGFERLTDEGSDKGMGRTYQVMAITPKSAPAPAGFEGAKHAEGASPLAVAKQADIQL